MKVFLACPAMEEMARRIAPLCGGKFEGIKWGAFPDSFPDQQLNPEVIDGNDIVFIACFQNPADIFAQWAVMAAIPRFLAKSLRVVLPFFPTGTMEWMKEAGQICTAKTLARLFSATPPCKNTLTEFVFYDLHNEREWFYFGDNIVVRAETAIPLIRHRVDTIIGDNAVIVFPDRGAEKRFERYFPYPKYERVIFDKQRDGDKRILTLAEGNPRGRDAVVVDDLVQTGGTLVECIRSLQGLGAATTSCGVVHGVFPEDSWKKFLDLGLSNFWVTDSLPQVNQLERVGPFGVVRLTEFIAGICQKF